MNLAGWPDSRDKTPVCIKEYWSYRDELTVDNRVIFTEKHVIIGKVLRPEMLARIHASHLGAETCLHKTRDIIF